MASNEASKVWGKKVKPLSPLSNAVGVSVEYVKVALKVQTIASRMLINGLFCTTQPQKLFCAKGPIF